MTEALIGLAAMLALSFLRVPIAISMGLVGFLGLWWMRGLGPSMASTTSRQKLSANPLNWSPKVSRALSVVKRSRCCPL